MHILLPLRRFHDNSPAFDPTSGFMVFSLGWQIVMQNLLNDCKRFRYNMQK
jgi:hypothetical protein